MGGWKVMAHGANMNAFPSVRKARRSPFPWRQHLPGALVASAVLAALLTWHPKKGEPVTPQLSTARFQVAVLAGPKQAEQKAPTNATEPVPDVKPAPPKKDVNTVAVAQRENSLPKAVKAAQDSSPGTEVAKPDDVIPPAQVSMPGGRLEAEDATAGEEKDPFSVGPRQVFIRLFVDAQGRVIRGGIVRDGNDRMRDAMILRAMYSRTFSTKNLMRIPGGQPIWQLDMTIDYGTNDELP
jgi:hypothetical protein